MGRESVKRLLVRGPNWIGDAVMSEPALAAVRELYPEAELTWLVKPTIAELFAGHPAVDHIMVYEDPGQHAGLAGKWALAEMLRRRRFDLAILFQNAFEAALLTFLAGIPRRYGYATDARGWLLSDPIQRMDRRQLRHQTQYYLDLLRPLGWRDSAALETFKVSAAQPKLFLTEQEERDLAQRLGDWGIGPGELVIGVNPGSTYGGAKRWLPERFAETAERVAGEQGRGRPVHIVILGAKGEEALGRAIAAGLRTHALVLSGKTTVRELMAVTRRCDLFLTNDTGPMHIAAAFGVPVVAVFGPTDHRTTSPVGQSHMIVREPVDCAPCLLRECPIDHRCMTRITADRVYAAAVQQLVGVAGRKSVPSGAARPGSAATSRTSLKGVTIFLDRDGTLNRDISYIKTPEELELLPGAVEAVARLKRAGARLILVTNQSGVARGFLTIEALKAIHARLLTLLDPGSETLDAIYFCPHHPDDGCLCRKPRTGMVERATADLGLDLSLCYVVGDQSRDIELGHRIGAHTVLVTTGPTSLESLARLKAEGRSPDHVAAGLDEAAAWIMEDATARSSQPDLLATAEEALP